LVDEINKNEIIEAYYTYRGRTGSYRILMWKPEGKKSPWKTWKSSREDNIKMGIQETG